MAKKLAVTPPLPPDALDPLRARGLEIVINQGPYPMNGHALATFIGEAGAAIVGVDEVSAAVFEACPNLRILARNGVGYERVDLDAATRHGVLVSITPGANSVSVAELTFGLLIAVARHIVPVHNRLQSGSWQRAAGTELAGKTLGIVGLGHIGKRVAQRALAFEMQVIANDIAPDHDFAREHGILLVSKDELWARSDVVSLHVPLTPLTRNLINAETLARLKPGAVLINTARGAVVDPEALAAALDRGHIAGAGLDVFTAEWQADPVLLHRPNVVTTTHLGAYTAEALRHTAVAAVRNILDILDGVRPAGLLNPEIWHQSSIQSARLSRGDL